MKLSTIRDKVMRWPVPYRMGAIFMAGFALFILFPRGGWKRLDILLHEARTMATVVESRSTSPGRCVVRYRYEVEGQTYTGGGAPDPGPDIPPIKIGTTYEIRYATAHPRFSCVEHPGIIFGQYVVGCLFVSACAFLGARSEAAKKSQSRAGSQVDGDQRDLSQ